MIIKNQNLNAIIAIAIKFIDRRFQFILINWYLYYYYYYYNTLFNEKSDVIILQKFPIFWQL